MVTTGVLRHLAVTGVLVLLIFDQIVVHGATAGRRPAPISSATQTNSNKGRKVMVEAFENAGRSPGLEIWRIEVKKCFFTKITIAHYSLLGVQKQILWMPELFLE